MGYAPFCTYILHAEGAEFQGLGFRAKFLIFGTAAAPRVDDFSWLIKGGKS